MSNLEYVLTTLFGIALTFVIIVLSNYLKRKIRNEADIEDTETITQIQEAVKQTFREQLSELELLNKHQLNISTEERDAIFNYNDSLYQYYFQSYNVFYDQKYSLADRYDELRDVFKEAEMKYVVNSERIKLFFNDVDFITLEASIRIAIGSLQSFVIVYHGEARKILNSPDEDRNKKSGEFFAKAHDDLTELRVDLSKNLTDMRDILNRFIIKVYK